MNILISATQAFCKYLNHDAPRLPSPDGLRIGTQPIQTTEHTIAWQCHAIHRSTQTGQAVDVIAVEAHSRYTLLFSDPAFASVESFIDALCERWPIESVDMTLDSDAATETKVAEMYQQFLDTPFNVEFYSNTDLSVHAQVSEAEQLMLQSYQDYAIDTLDNNEEYGLGRHINQIHKVAKPFPGAKKKETFLPMSRMLDDWLFRFCRGLSEWEYPQTPVGDFPNPYAFYDEASTTETSKKRDNVVSIEEARKKLRSVIS